MQKYITMIPIFLIGGCTISEAPKQSHEVETMKFIQQSNINTYSHGTCYGNGKISCKLKRANKRLDSINKHLLEIDNTLSCCGGY